MYRKEGKKALSQDGEAVDPSASVTYRQFTFLEMNNANATAETGNSRIHFHIKVGLIPKYLHFVNTVQKSISFLQVA